MKLDRSPCFRDIPTLISLQRMIVRCRPTVIHGHSSKAGALVRILKASGAVPPVVYTPHAYFGMGGNETPMTRFFTFIERCLGRFGTTINISPDEAAFARDRIGLSERQSRVIHNPVNPERFTPPTPEEKRVARIRLGLPLDSLLIGSVGRLSPQKNPLMLTSAFALEARRQAGISLVHLGGGPLADEVRQLRKSLDIDQLVFCPEYMEDPRLFYHAVDALVMSSDYEAGWPIVILEALCCQLPIITTTAPGMSEIGKSGLSHCWTAAPNDIASLADALHAWRDSLDHESKPSNHRDYVFSHFTPEICYGRVLDCYRELVQKEANREG